MSSRYLIPLAVAAALALPVTAQAEEGTWEPGKWLFRVGLSQINPDKENLDVRVYTEQIPGSWSTATFRRPPPSST